MPTGAAVLRPYQGWALAGKREHQQIALAGRDYRELAVGGDGEIAEGQAVENRNQRGLGYRRVLIFRGSLFGRTPFPALGCALAFSTLDDTLWVGQVFRPVP